MDIKIKSQTDKIRSCFPMSFINMRWELIIHPKRNSYFNLLDCETDLDVQCKVLEWLSREAIKGGTRQSMKYHLDGINKFFDKEFTVENMEKIYCELGNRVNHKLTIRFIESGLDLNIFEKE